LRALYYRQDYTSSVEVGFAASLLALTILICRPTVRAAVSISFTRGANSFGLNRTPISAAAGTSLRTSSSRFANRSDVSQARLRAQRSVSLGGNRSAWMTQIAALGASAHLVDHGVRPFILHLEGGDQRILRLRP
jgi:hypothetical protein